MARATIRRRLSIAGRGDAGGDQRQVHMIDATAASARTRGRLRRLGGHRLDADFSVAGNMLAVPVWRRHGCSIRVLRAQPFAERLIAALRRAKRRCDSAASKRLPSLICTTEDYPALDLAS